MNGVAVIIYMNTVNPKEIIISASPNLELIYPMTMVYLRMYVSATKHYGGLGHEGPKT